MLAISLAMRGEVEAGLTQVQRAMVRMEATRNTVGIVQTRSYLLAVCLELPDAERLLAESRLATATALQLDYALHGSVGLDYQAVALSRLGWHVEAMWRMAEAQALAARVGGAFIMSDWLTAAQAEIAHNAGAYEDALARADNAVTVASNVGGSFAQGWAQRIWRLALAALGSRASARSRSAPGRKRAAATLLRSPP